jgi:NAD(P)-dependent dehydrogenase (short-subunit alcohol dehydrogenase family)
LGVRCIPNSIGYSTSKAALIHFSKCLALEYAVRGIRVNCISPGYFKSDMTKDVINNPVLYRGMLSKIPNHRLLKVEEIIPFIRLVISDAGSYITGANIVIDGGLSCW